MVAPPAVRLVHLASLRHHVNMAAIEGGARFGHVNVTGPDWRVLATFYGSESRPL
jgi:hypothetical protein